MANVSVDLLQVAVRVVQWQSGLELALLLFTLSHNVVEARLRLSNLHIMRLRCHLMPHAVVTRVVVRSIVVNEYDNILGLHG